MSSLKSFAQCCRAMATLSRWTSPQYCRGPSTSYRNRKVLGGTGCSHRRHWLCSHCPPRPLARFVCYQTEHGGGRAEEQHAVQKNGGKGFLCHVPRSPGAGHGLVQPVLLPGHSCEPSWNGSSHTHPLLTVMLSYSEISSLTLIFEGYLQTTQNVSSSFSWFLMHLYRDGVGNDCCIQEGFVWRMIWGWFLWKPLKRNLVLLENEKSPTSMSHIPFLMFSL